MVATDEEAALLAISSLASLDDLSKEQRQAKDRIDGIVRSDDPFVDIHELFGLYNVLYFRSLLVPRVEVSWSPRLTLCAGICELVRDPNNGNKYTRIRLKLSEPLLKYRPRSDVINTLLHEAIHAYFFVTTDWKHVRGDDGTGHGAGFLLLADAINSHGGYGVPVYHTFHDEVDSYRTHVWQCDGICREQAPFFGLVKLSMNRAPGKSDSWWTKHQQDCSGTFTKISEPEPTKEQLQRMNGLDRAGQQKNKLDSWIVSSKRQSATHGTRHSSPDDEYSTSNKVSEISTDAAAGNDLRGTVDCPICGIPILLQGINNHIDQTHPT